MSSTYASLVIRAKSYRLKDQDILTFQMIQKTREFFQCVQGLVNLIILRTVIRRFQTHFGTGPSQSEKGAMPGHRPSRRGVGSGRAVSGSTRPVAIARNEEQGVAVLKNLPKKVGDSLFLPRAKQQPFVPPINEKGHGYSWVGTGLRHCCFYCRQSFFWQTEPSGVKRPSADDGKISASTSNLSPPSWKAAHKKKNPYLTTRFHQLVIILTRTSNLARGTRQYNIDTAPFESVSHQTVTYINGPVSRAFLDPSSFIRGWSSS